METSSGPTRSPWSPRSLPSEGAWRGQACVVVGGGPSLRDFDWSVLSGVHRCIVINRSYSKVPGADVFFTEDSRFVKRFGNDPAFRDFKGLKIVHLLDDGYASDIAPFLDDLVIIRKKRSDKFWAARLEEGLSVSSNSAIGAVNLAEILGANRIFLLGMDCTANGNDTNFHDDYPPEWKVGRHQLEDFASDWRHWVKIKCQVPIWNVVNLKMPSKLDCFPVMTFDEFYATKNRHLLHA